MLYIKITAETLDDARLDSWLEMGVYSFISGFTTKGYYGEVKYIAKTIKESTNTVRRCLIRLEEKGALRKIQGARGTTNTYFVIPPAAVPAAAPQNVISPQQQQIETAKEKETLPPQEKKAVRNLPKSSADLEQTSPPAAPQTQIPPPKVAADGDMLKSSSDNNSDLELEENIRKQLVDCGYTNISPYIVLRNFLREQLGGKYNVIAYIAYYIAQNRKYRALPRDEKENIAKSALRTPHKWSDFFAEFGVWKKRMEIAEAERQKAAETAKEKENAAKVEEEADIIKEICPVCNATIPRSGICKNSCGRYSSGKFIAAKDDMPLMQTLYRHKKVV